jgi:hypothetical protein
MRKNLIIAGLIFWNLILMTVLVFVWVKGPHSSHAVPNMSFAGSTQGDIVTTDVQEFTFKAGEHLNGDVAPQIAERAFAITAVFDRQQQDGVIVAQGGLAHGYALYVVDGELLFAVRRNQALTTVSGGKLGEGRHKLAATFSKTGELGLVVDGRPAATAKTAGVITLTPVDGLDVGADRGAPVGLYEVPNSFGGTIDAVTVKTFQ